jgi:hypothetical protein
MAAPVVVDSYSIGVDFLLAASFSFDQTDSPTLSFEKIAIHVRGRVRNEQGILGEVDCHALKQALSLQLDQLLKKEKLTKTQMAARMKTSCAAVDRLLDASNSWVTLNTLGKAARALGHKVKIELVPA